jgi:hypothetical protein
MEKNYRDLINDYIELVKSKSDFYNKYGLTSDDFLFLYELAEISVEEAQNHPFFKAIDTAIEENIKVYNVERLKGEVLGICVGYALGLKTVAVIDE